MIVLVLIESSGGHIEIEGLLRAILNLAFTHVDEFLVKM